VLSGDVMQEGALFYKEIAQEPTGLLVSNDFVLCTVHRAENTDDPKRLTSITSALNKIAQSKQVILPLHPRTKKILETGDYDTSNLVIIDPVGYLNMIWLINNCALVMTDSGGLQKEAYFFAKPCITMRDETEWVELIDIGANILVGANEEKIIDAYLKSTSFPNYDMDLFGLGEASKILVRKIISCG
jgi:UDP-GlcNAc3NAcA epimerase